MRRLLALALLLLLAVPVAGQGVRVLDADADASAAPGRVAELTWVVAVIDGQDHPLLASVEAPGASGWRLSVEPTFVNVAAGETQVFTVSAQPSGRADPHEIHVVLTLEDPAANATLTVDGTARATGLGTVLGAWENPLPAPLDGTVGTFLLNIVAWLVVAIIVMWLVNPTLKLLTLKTKTTFDDRIVAIAARPVFILVFAYGIKASASALPLPTLAFRVLDVLWMLALVVILVYAAFRLWHEVVLALGRGAVGRTKSTLDDRLLPLLEKTGGILIVLVGFFYLADGFGWNMTWLAAGGAIGGLVIAFAAQDTLGNFFSGVHLLIDRPFVEGDDIILDTGEVCTVRKIGLRSTDLYHPLNHEVIIVPNSIIAQNRIINILQPDKLYKVTIKVGVAYGTDVQKVKAILMDLGRSHPLSLDEKGHEPFVRFSSFGDSSLDFSLTVWLGDVYARYAVASDLREMVEQAFAEHGIEIPFPQRVLWTGREEADRGPELRPHKPLRLHGSIADATKDLPGQEDAASDGEPAA